MAQAKTWKAFDVHTSAVVAAVLERESGELRVQRLAAGSEAVTAFARVCRAGARDLRPRADRFRAGAAFGEGGS
jgi:hypothetical protein